ncbi:MAG: DNA primase [Erysipelothrix sp.]|nr:DNA primase [Erysipelothrix sp.]
MARIDNEIINNIRQSANISDIISQYIPIEKKGRNFVAICPFHEDTNPSMSISEEKQIYKCFVCGAGGNVFTFVSKYNNLEFIQSVKVVADFVNIPLDVQVTSRQPQVEDSKLLPYAIMSESMNYFNYRLVNTNEANIIDYLKERDLSEADIEYFNIGYESDNSLINFMEKKEYTNRQLVNINLINEGDYGVRSVFNNRLLFPIHTEFGQVVGYSGRALISDANIAKYINSSENDIYHKGSILYNYHRALDTVKQENEIYLVEGVMDVIGFYKGHVKNAVATLGTAMTREQVKLLSKHANSVVLAYDGDSAGALATIKAIGLLLDEKVKIEVLDGFGDMDPDDYVKAHGVEAFQAVLVNRLSYIDYLIKYFLIKYNIENFEERKQFTIDLSKYLSKIESALDREYLIGRISELTKFSEHQIANLNVIEKPKVKPHIIHNDEIKIERDRAEFNLIGQMLSGKEASLYIRDNLGFLTNPNLYSIYLSIIDHYQKYDLLSQADLISLMSQASPELEDLILHLINNDMIIKDYNKDIIDENIKLVQINMIDDSIKQLRSRIFLNDNEQIEMIAEIAKLQKQKVELLGK